MTGRREDEGCYIDLATHLLVLLRDEGCIDPPLIHRECSPWHLVVVEQVVRGEGEGGEGGGPSGLPSLEVVLEESCKVAQLAPHLPHDMTGKLKSQRTHDMAGS